MRLDVDESDPVCLDSIVEGYDGIEVGVFGGVHICPLELGGNPLNMDMAEVDGGFERLGVLPWQLTGLEKGR